MKRFLNYITETGYKVGEPEGGRVQIHYTSTSKYSQKTYQVIATVPPVQEDPIHNKAELNRYVTKFVKDMKTNGLIDGDQYKIVFPHDAAWRSAKSAFQQRAEKNKP